MTGEGMGSWQGGGEARWCSNSWGLRGWGTWGGASGGGESEDIWESTSSPEMEGEEEEDEGRLAWETGHC